MNRQWFIVGALITGSSVLAQRVIDIGKKGEGKISINLGGYRTGSDAASKTFLSVLKADLNRSGHFSVTSSGGALNVAGACQAGSQMKADVHVYQVATKKKLLGKSYNAAANSARGLAHKVADEMSEEALKQFMAGLKQQVTKRVNSLPSHHAFLSQYLG